MLKSQKNYNHESNTDNCSLVSHADLLWSAAPLGSYLSFLRASKHGQILFGNSLQLVLQISTHAM